MPHDLNAPRVVIASGMAGTGVSTIAGHIQRMAPMLNVIEGGTRRADILDACMPYGMPRIARLLAITTDDLVSVAATYALIKLARDRFPDVPIEIVVNRCEARNALKAYERIQHAAVHFLNETIGYGGSIPEHEKTNAPGTIDDDAISAIQDIAVRLDAELDAADVVNDIVNEAVWNYRAERKQS